MIRNNLVDSILTPIIVIMFLFIMYLRSKSLEKLKEVI